MSKFDFFDDILNDSSKGQMNTDVMVDIDRIHPYEINDEIYPSEQYQYLMGELIESIREKGLIQSVELIPHPTIKGDYISIGGNRRCSAIRHLVHDEGLEKYRMVKAHIDENYDELDAKENCVLSNGYRDKTPFTIMKEIEILQSVVEERKARGEKIKGSVRAYIAQRSNLGETQTGKIQRILKKGSDELKEAIQDNIVSLEAAAEVSTLDNETQVEIVNDIKSGNLTNAEAIKHVKDLKNTPSDTDETVDHVNEELVVDDNGVVVEDDDTSNDSTAIDQFIVVGKKWTKVKKLLTELLDDDPKHYDVINEFLHKIED